MNKLKLVSFWGGFLYVFLVAPGALSAQLTLEIQGHENKLGQLHIAISQVNGLLSDDVLWDDLEPVRKLQKDIGPDQAQQDIVPVIIENLPVGLICIRLYLDLNNNQLLERSAIGLPLEPVGFSNNPALFKGEPTPRDSCFLLQETSNVQKIKLKQHKKRK